MEIQKDDLIYTAQKESEEKCQCMGTWYELKIAEHEERIHRLEMALKNPIKGPENSQGDDFVC